MDFKTAVDGLRLRDLDAMERDLVRGLLRKNRAQIINGVVRVIG